jgi:hypothetical protein
VWGAGNYAMAGSDAKIFQMNEKFKGWGGEDDDFLSRVRHFSRPDIIYPVLTFDTLYF